jgi:serine/threonine protein kinase
MLFGYIPWNAISEYELMSNINKIPLTFPPTIEVREDTKAFLKGCLQADEKARMSWLEIYSHPIFGGRFKQFT